MKRSPVAWLLVGALTLGLLMSWCDGRRGDAERAAAIARADTLEQLANALEAAHVRDSTAAAAETERLADSLAQVDRALTTAKDVAHRLAAAIIRDSGAVPRVQVLEALAAKDAVIAQQEQKIQTLVADTAAWRLRWLQAMREGVSWRQVSIAARQQLAEANERSRPKRFGCTGGATAMVGLVGTGGAGVGITCGITLHLLGSRGG